MKPLICLTIVILFCSCSTLKKTLVYSSLSGGVTGATAGALLSPNKESSGANAAVFGLIGAGIAAVAGYALYQDDPRNLKLKQMLIPEKDNKPKFDQNEFGIDIGKINIDAKLDKSEAYEVPIKELPPELQGKVDKQYLIKYQAKERYIRQGGKTLYIPPFEVFEHNFGNSLD